MEDVPAETKWFNYVKAVPQNKCPQFVWTGNTAVCRQTGQSRLVGTHECVNSGFTEFLFFSS